jgi:hypothetical protein
MAEFCCFTVAGLMLSWVLRNAMTYRPNGA